MQDCQQGIRDTSGQILSVVAITGTMLTLFFGVSIFGDKINESVARSNGQLIEFADHGNNMFGRACDILEKLLTVRRIAFWFTSIIFLVSVLYIIVLGIGNVLRYHYCQHLAVVYFLVNTVLLLLCGLVTFRKTKRGVIFLFNLCLSFGGINVLLHCFLNDTLTPDLFGIVLALSVTASVIFIRMAPKTSIRKVLRDSIFIVKKCLFGEYVAKESG